MMRPARFLWPAIMTLLVAFLVGPLLLVVLFSFNANSLISFPMGGVSLDWYRRLLADPEFHAALRNSLAIAVPTAVVSTVTGTMAAYALAQWGQRRALPLLSILSLPVMMPPLVIAIALVVLYRRWLSVPLGLATVIGGHVLVTQPFVAAVVAARMATFDFTGLDAARDLGATRWQTFRKVTLPQVRSAVIGAALIAFALSLDEFIITAFTIGGGNTLSTFVWGKIKTTLDPSINAIATILLTMTIGATFIALRVTRYRG
ncbi:MAG: ABC transporter permease [Pseudomonadota bacterium]|nr:ABC transporter permease [Pseudomonadota bacterium]